MNNYPSDFINIKLSQKTVYVYSVRKLLQNSLNKSISKFTGSLIDIGCGEMPYRQYILDNNSNVKKYIGIDVDFNPIHQTTVPDLQWDGKTITSASSSFETAIATEFFEHISNIDQVLIEIRRILKSNGLLYFTVPFIWPLHETPFDQYRYTPYSLTRHLEDAGFRNIQIYPLGGHNASLAQMLCIWLYNFSKNNKILSRLISIVIFTTIKLLLQLDLKQNTFPIQENTISPGFYGYAYK